MLNFVPFPRLRQGVRRLVLARLAASPPAIPLEVLWSIQPAWSYAKAQTACPPGDAWPRPWPQTENLDVYSSWYPRGVGLSSSAEETIEIAAETGFASVDLQVLDLVRSETDCAVLRRRMDDTGLRGGAWPLPVFWRGEAAQFEADLKRLPSLAGAAATLGLFRTGTWVMPETIAAAEPDSDHHELRVATSGCTSSDWARSPGILADWGCRLGLEIMGPATARTGPGVPFVTRYAELKQWFSLREGSTRTWACWSILSTCSQLKRQLMRDWNGEARPWSGYMSLTRPRRTPLLCSIRSASFRA